MNTAPQHTHMQKIICQTRAAPTELETHQHRLYKHDAPNKAERKVRWYDDRAAKKVL